MLYPPAEAHSKPSQASNMEFLARTVKNFKLSLLAFFAKRSIADVRKRYELIKCFTIHE